MSEKVPWIYLQFLTLFKLDEKLKRIANYQSNAFLKRWNTYYNSSLSDRMCQSHVLWNDFLL